MRLLKDACGLIVTILVYSFFIGISLVVIFVAIEPLSLLGYLDFYYSTGIFLAFVVLSF